MIKAIKPLIVTCILSSFACAASMQSAGVFERPSKVDVKNGERIYNSQCVSCHGPKGMAAQDSFAPPLNGQYALYQVIQLKAFSDKRPEYKRTSNDSAMMIPFAEALSDQEMWDVSVYLENIKERREFPKEWYDKNKEILEKDLFVCIGCHGANGTGRVPSAGKIAGLQTKYIMKQLKSFQTGERKGGMAYQMKLFREWIPNGWLRNAIPAESNEGIK